MLKIRSVDESLIEQFVAIESELTTANNLADYANQASIWQFNALVFSSAFIDRERHADLIVRLTHASREADAIKSDADSVVAKLREEKRALALTVGAHVNSKEMERARKEAEKRANANAKVLEAEAKAIEEAEANAIREADSTPEPTQMQPVKTKRKSKTQLVTEATNA
jgi:glucan-binding YG repeat protein